MTRRIACLLTAFFIIHAVPVDVFAQAAKRQFYSSGKEGGVGKWERDENAKCYKIWWHFKVNPNDEKYERHIAYCFDDHPELIYFYNPGTKKFWGRCHFVKDRPARSTYSELKPEDQKPRLSQITECAFPPSEKMPRLKATDEAGRVRQSQDGVAMEPPPPPPI